VRARHPPLRDLPPQPPRLERDPGGEGAEPPAGDRGPLARHRPPGQGGADGPRRDRGRRRRSDHRGPPRPGPRALGRAAVALPGTVLGAGGADPHHRLDPGPATLAVSPDRGVKADGAHFDLMALELDRALAELLALLERDPALWTRAQRGKWSAGQHAEHVA